jgi:hypothetical protein
MPRDIDVYQLLRAFAQRNKLSSVDYSVFSRAVQRQAGQSDQSEPLFRDLAANPDTILVPRLYKLARERKVSLEMIGGELASIVLPEHYAEVFFLEYRRMDENPEIPFPDEESLKTSVPHEWIRQVSMEADLALLSERQAGPVSATDPALVRLAFPNVVRPIVLPLAFIPDKLLEYSVLKLRHYLRKAGNKEYIQNKLLYAFAGRENQLKDVMGAVLLKPMEAIEAMRTASNDLVYPFWAYFTSNVKQDLDKKQGKTPEDFSFYQAALICEFYSIHYKGKAKRILDREFAAKSLGQAFRKPPFYFSIEDVSAFKDAQGQPLLGKLSREEMENYLREKTSASGEEGSGLPEILVLPMGQGKRIYVAKDRLFLLASRLVLEARNECQSRLVADWKRLLEELSNTPAMEDDDLFRRLLSDIVAGRCLLLDSIIKSRLLPLYYAELSAKGDPPPEASHFLYKGELLPLDRLLDLDRKRVLADARVLLPFWLSVPFFAGLARFFRGLGQGKAEKAPAPAEKRELVKTRDESMQTLKEIRGAYIAAADKVASELLPEGYELDDYLKELEGRWNTLLNVEAKKNLREDVNSLVRDYLKSILRNMSPSGFTTSRIQGLAETLCATPAMQKLKNHGPLKQYVELYMVKLMKKR